MPHREDLQHPTYRADIDGLRAVAVLSVLAFHAFPEFARGGFIGVDVFFVISGFLISTIIFENLDRGSFRFFEFYSRRIRRIFPALIVVLTACLVFAWLVLFADELAQLGKHVAGGAGFVSNIVLWKESGYFDSDAVTKPLLHLWSLGIEEQFYIVWPLLCWALWKRHLGWLAATSLAALASFAWNLREVGIDAVAAFYSPQTRCWELLLGALLAMAAMRAAAALRPDAALPDAPVARSARLLAYASGSSTFGNSMAWLGAAALAMGELLIGRGSDYPGYWALLPTLGTALLIAAGTRAWFNRTLLAHRVLVWFGLISFPLYLWHWPLLSFARVLAGGPLPAATRAALAAASVPLAWLTYRAVERPMRFGDLLRAKTAALVALMVLAGCLGYGCWRDEGFPQRSANQRFLQYAQAFAWPSDKEKSQACFNYTGLTNLQYCLMTRDRKPDTALIGDSHADAIFDFVENRVAGAQGGLVLLGSGGCPPLLGVERNDFGCAPKFRALLDYLRDNKDIRHVYITGRFAAMESGINFGRDPRPDFYRLKLVADEAQADRRTILRTGFEGTLSDLEAAGKRITVLLDVPELDFDPRRCLRSAAEVPCAIERSIVLQRQEGYTAMFRELQARHNFKIVDLKEALCGARVCAARADNRMLYRDSHHLSVFGNRYLIDSRFQID